MLASAPPAIGMLVQGLAAGSALAPAVSPITMLPRKIPAASKGPDTAVVIRRATVELFIMVS
ncbi:MAG: hypothetical protein U0R66_05910 [Mycobacterium sp.]